MTTIELPAAEEIAFLARKLAEAEAALDALAAGQVDAVLSPGGDTILLRQAQQALCLANERVHHLLAHIPAIIYSIDANDSSARTIVAGNSITHVLGFSREEADDPTWWSRLIHPQDRELASQGLATARAAGTSRSEYRVCHRDGSYRWIEDQQRLVRGEDGEAVEIIGVWTDITEKRRQEERMRASEASLAAAQRVAHLGSWEIDLLHPTDLNRCPTRWSDELFRIYGFEPQQFSPSSPGVLEMVHPDDRSRLAGALADLVHEAKSYDLTYRIVRGDGMERVVHERAEFAPSVGCPRIMGTIQDITRRMRAEEARQQSEERFGKIFRSSPIPIAYADTGAGGFIDVNESWAEFFGYTREEMVGWTDRDRGLWVDLGERDALLAQLATRGTVQGFECRLRRKSGEIRVALFSVEMLRFGSQSLQLSMLTDITERKQSEEALRLQSRVLESMAEGVNVWDLAERTILFTNRACEAMFGHPPGGLIGQPITILHDMAEPENHAFVTQMVDQLQQTGTWSGEVPNRKKDGTSFVTRVRVSAFDLAGRKCGVTVREDITATKLLESQLLRVQRMESLGRLASGIAHDMNNILAPIMMVPSLLRSCGMDAAETERLLSNVEISAERGAHLVKQLLYFGRGVEGQHSLLRFKDAVRQIEDIIGQTFPKSITIRTDVGSDVWPIRGDPTQIHQVLLNLCVNAMDAMPQGGVLSIKVRNLEVTADFPNLPAEATVGPHVLLSVIDTGTGISAKNVEKIFDPFFTTKEIGKGTGLGLSTVLGIVKNHRGFVTLDTKLGHGSAFHIYLPASPNAEADATPKPNSRPPMGSNELVLLVDDEVGIREIACELLTRNGYRVLTAGDGREAYELFQQYADQIQLVITDVDMPLMDGIRLSHLLKSTAPSTKIIVVTGKHSGFQSEERAIELQQAGIAARLAKPFTPHQILALAHQVIAGS